MRRWIGRGSVLAGRSPAAVRALGQLYLKVVMVLLVKPGPLKVSVVLRSRSPSHCTTVSSLQNEDDARDVLHDVFVALQRKGERFEGKSSIATYLYSMTTHACLNWLRNRRTRARLLAGYRPGPEFIAARGERRALAVELLAQLSPDDAALAVYLHCDELTHEEIAALRGCSRRHIGDLAARLQRELQERVA